MSFRRQTRTQGVMNGGLWPFEGKNKGSRFAARAIKCCLISDDYFLRLRNTNPTGPRIEHAARTLLGSGTALKLPVAIPPVGET